MSDLYKRIENLCLSRNVTITDMCRESGAPRGSLTDLKMGRTDGLSARTLSKISAYFGVPIDVLLGEEDIKKEPVPVQDELSEDTKAIIELVKNLPEEKLKLLLPMIKAAAEAD